ncbi:MAG: hypothetical protein U1A06_21095 [Hoeflea sp.]|nr:hypothetical protein [Hoeflea sp.]
MSLDQRQMVIARSRVIDPGQKDFVMLYVFNSANRVQIAWNGVLPTQKANQKPRTSIVNSLIRTLSAG